SALELAVVSAASTGGPTAGAGGVGAGLRAAHREVACRVDETAADRSTGLVRVAAVGSREVGGESASADDERPAARDDAALDGSRSMRRIPARIGPVVRDSH